MTLQEDALALHAKHKGKLATKSKIPVRSRADLSLIYTPGVAAVSLAVAKDKAAVNKYTLKPNAVAVISDGSAVLGLGNIGPEAALPVMEGKAVLFKELADIDAWPICLASQDVQLTIQTVKNIAPVFGGINLEDFKAPECFVIEAALQDLGIPVMHDDQHGTAIVVLAGLINASKVVRKNLADLKVVISGAGAAGTAVAKLFLLAGIKDIILLDTKG
ncbi:MAG: malic enzyme-like NAD(P)-binding protein, partial [Nanoarchaeota archaeon]